MSDVDEPDSSKSYRLLSPIHALGVLTGLSHLTPTEMQEMGWDETEKLDKAHTQRQCGSDSRSAPTPPQPFPWLQCSSACEQSQHTLAYFLLQPNSHLTISCSLHPVPSLGRRNVLASHILELKGGRDILVRNM